METAALIGLSILEFWNITPFEFSFLVRAYVDKSKQDQEERITLTYLGVYWNRVKKMPSLKSILEPKEKKKQQTPETMLDFVKGLNEALGGNVV